MLGALASVFLLGATLGAEPSRAASADAIAPIALEVLNERSGRHLLHFEDVIGPSARRSARAALIYAMPLDGCEACPEELAQLDAVHERAKAAGGFVAVVVLTRPQGAARARAELSRSPHGYVIALDAYALSKDRLGLVGPGHGVVVRWDGRIVERFGPRSGALGAAVKAFLDELEAKEDLP